MALWQAFENAIWAEARGDREAAVAGLRELVAKEPRKRCIPPNLAAVLRRAGRSGEAIDVLAVVEQTAPGDALAWHERASVLAEAGRIDEAMRAEREAIRLAPSLPEPHSHLGILLAGQGRVDEALAAFDEAIRLDPNNARAWNNRANVLRGKGRRGSGGGVSHLRPPGAARPDRSTVSASWPSGGDPTGRRFRRSSPRPAHFDAASTWPSSRLAWGADAAEARGCSSLPSAPASPSVLGTSRSPSCLTSRRLIRIRSHGLS